MIYTILGILCIALFFAILIGLTASMSSWETALEIWGLILFMMALILLGAYFLTAPFLK